ncbi:MAG: hypothetical protein GXY20_12005 [Clostridiales bacterium]|nr:hypothetical protein [Clostridiales bacterium]
MGIFTYDEFEKKARESGIYDQFSQADLKLSQKYPEFGMSMLRYKLDYKNAETSDARALIHSEAEALRQRYGYYSGGADGSGYYDGGSALNSERGRLLGKLLDREPFSFDPNDSEAYASYRKQYLREGERAASNALAGAAALTGGMPSTAAVTAASQAGDYYASKLADRLPEIMNDEYARYSGGYNLDLNALKTVSGLEESEYDRETFADSLEAEWSAERRKTAREEVNMMLEMNQMPDAELLAAAGYTQGLGEGIGNYYASLLEGAGSFGGGGGAGAVYAPDIPAEEEAPRPGPDAAQPAQEPEPPGVWDRIDAASVAALGYGPISYDMLRRLVEMGKAEVVSRNGKLYVKRAQPDTDVSGPPPLPALPGA